MDTRVVKVQVKVYFEGNEDHAITMSSDILRRYNLLMQSVIIAPKIDNWIQETARILFERPAPIQSTVFTPNLISNINIMPNEQPLPDIKIDEPDADITLIENQVPIEIADVSQVNFPDDLQTEKALDIIVTPQEIPDAHVKKQVRVIVRHDALEKAKEHSRKDTSRETGGVMLGMFSEDETSITVFFTGIVRALSAVRETSAVKFTPETWAEIWAAIDQDKDYSDENVWGIIGWYHTHPNFGIFLSGHDKFIQKEYFTRRGHLALVIDPVRDEMGFFVTDKETNDTSILEESVIAISKEDKDFDEPLKLFNQKHLPAIEIAVPKEKEHE